MQHHWCDIGGQGLEGWCSECGAYSTPIDDEPEVTDECPGAPKHEVARPMTRDEFDALLALRGNA